MNIEQEIKELRKKLDELKKQVNDKNKKWRFIPKASEYYYCVNSVGSATKYSNEKTLFDEYNIQTGNYFKTEEEAERHNRILINTQKLKDLAERLNNGKKIDWNDSCPKYYIYLKEGKLDYCWNRITQMQGVVFCLDENFLDKAIEEIGEESLIELIKGE